MNIAALEQKKVSELYEIARHLGIEGYTNLRRRDLIYEILGALADADAGDADLAPRIVKAADDRPSARPRGAGPTGTSSSSRRAARASRTRQPIGPDWPAYMQGFDPLGVSLEGLTRKVGILEILPDGYGFLRSVEYSYLPSPDDIYVSPSQIKRFSLRIGDTVDGQIRPPKEGERFFALIRVHSINGRAPEDFDERTGFDFLTPSYPDQSLRLETTPDVLATRVVDLVAPIGKGQRGLLVAPPHAGRTVLLQQIAQGLAANDPETTVLVVLIDEQPEEVAEFQRHAPRAEVVGSTFGDDPERQVHIADLVLEKARRLVEAGQDVVVLLDSLTRLARAHVALADGGGRTIAGGIAASALRGPKRLFGAARAAEEGGSLTVIATVLVETGAQLDEALFEEFKGTGHMELVLSNALADQRLFPAIDLAASGTRREEILLPPTRLARIRALRDRLAGLEPGEALREVLDGMRSSDDNDGYLETISP